MLRLVRGLSRGTSGSLTCPTPRCTLGMGGGAGAGAPAASGTIPGNLSVTDVRTPRCALGGGGREQVLRRLRGLSRGTSGSTCPTPRCALGGGGGAGAGPPRAQCAGDAQAAGFRVLEPHLGVVSGAGVLAAGCSPRGCPAPSWRGGCRGPALLHRLLQAQGFVRDAHRAGGTSRGGVRTAVTPATSGRAAPDDGGPGQLGAFLRGRGHLLRRTMPRARGNLCPGSANLGHPRDWPDRAARPDAGGWLPADGARVHQGAEGPFPGTASR